MDLLHIFVTLASSFPLFPHLLSIFKMLCQCYHCQVDNRIFLVILIIRTSRLDLTEWSKMSLPSCHVSTMHVWAGNSKITHCLPTNHLVYRFLPLSAYRMVRCCIIVGRLTLPIDHCSSGTFFAYNHFTLETQCSWSMLQDAQLCYLYITPQCVKGTHTWIFENLILFYKCPYVNFYCFTSQLSKVSLYTPFLQTQHHIQM